MRIIINKNTNEYTNENIPYEDPATIITIYQNQRIYLSFQMEARTKEVSKVQLENLFASSFIFTVCFSSSSPRFFH